MRRGVVCLALGVVLALPHAAVAQQPQQRTITAIGTSSAPVTPTDRNNNESIKSAIAAARIAGVGPALTSARARGELIAQAAGVTLGAIQSIDETVANANPYFGGGPGELGTFGPGEFCGTVPRYVTRRSGNRVRRVRKGTRRICRFPNAIETRLAVTYAIQ